jgi:KDO transferase-3
MSKGYFGGRTIPFAALQLAYHLGFSKVFLVGVDMNAQPGRFYEQGEAALPTRLDEDYEDYILPSFELLAEQVVGPAFQVFNLSQTSRLPGDLVPVIDLHQLDALLASA